MRSYVTNKLQHCKINNSFSNWAKISAGVPQGSILGQLLFNISISLLISDIFLFLQKQDLANYVDDSTVYTSDKRVFTITDSLRHKFNILSKWFCTISWFLTQKNANLCCQVLTIHCKPTWYVVIKFLKTQDRKKCQV